MTKDYGKTKAKSDRVVVMVKIGREWIPYGQSGVRGWTYQQLFDDTWNHQISNPLKDYVTDWKVKENKKLKRMM